MVGSSGSSTLEVFNNIMQTDGWKGLFRGNFVNVIRVAPSKAIEGNWMIKVRLTSKGNMRTYKNARGEGCVFNVELTDEDGTQIQATMFNEAARKFYEKFQLGKVYYISRGTLKVANKQFKTVQNDYEMTLNENSVVEEASNEETFIPETKFNFVPIDQLGPYVNGRELVDHTCIDCDTCRWMAPQVFTRVGEMSAVYKQPTSSEDRLKALQALLSCPTSSIRTEVPPPDILEAQKTFPIPVDEKNLPGVYHCGYHSEKSYGAASYLIIHPGGNILIDSPRFTEKLAKEIETMGGVRYLFLTHKDDVADHAKWATRFSCDRILHSEDVEICTADVEMKLEGNGPWSLGDDIMLVHAPGHTEGTVCLLYKPLKILFTGDHLIMTESGLSIIEMYNKYSVPKQVDSVQKLIQFDFDWIIPGHGRRIEFKDVREKNTVLEAFVREKCNQYSSSYK